MTLNGFSYHQFGYASAIAVLILVSTIILSLILNKIFRSETYEL